MSRIIVKLAGIGLVALVVLGLAIQLVPYGRAHANPAARVEPAWDRPETRALAVRACFDCHSNETVWPWYSNIAPVSWLLQRHVDEGREALNFSEWDRPQRKARESAEQIREGEMPTRDYLLIHPEARLSSEDRQVLAQGLAAIVGGNAASDGERDRRTR